MTQTLLTPDQAASLLSITTKQLRLLTEEGHLRWINVGLGSKRPTRRYELQDIEEFKSERARKCQSTKGPARTSTPMTSSFRVVDFRAIREQGRSEKRKPSKAESETRPG